MAQVKVLADALNSINTAAKRRRLGSYQAMLQSYFQFLTVMMKHSYVGQFEIIDAHRAWKIVVNPTGRLNKRGVISPICDVQLKDLEKWQNNPLPFHQCGFIVLTTSSGIMNHEEARQKHPAGKIWGFFFYRCNKFVQTECLNGREKKMHSSIFTSPHGWPALSEHLPEP
ncbi:40S ribosomal protein S15a-like [Camelus ferus]|uniref:Small ribosomal subunit protein uS8 n=1 Tax=Camelus ferus TaxID=419612 RepID=A0A8B8RNL3_CAMFR|nr:40S ribosomal protein S15a-like [Camelus ferus]